MMPMCRPRSLAKTSRIERVRSKAALGGLIGVGGGADGDAVFAGDAPQFLAQQVGGGRFGVDLVLERGHLHFHEFVGVARIAIFAAELAAAVGIDAPTERHAGLDPVQHAARRDFEILNAALGFEQFAGGGELGDSYECHTSFSLFVRLIASAVNLRCFVKSYCAA